MHRQRADFGIRNSWEMRLSWPLNFFCNGGFSLPGCRWDVGPLHTLPNIYQKGLPPEAICTKPRLGHGWAVTGQRLGAELLLPNVQGRPGAELEWLEASALGQAIAWQPRPPCLWLRLGRHGLQNPSSYSDTSGRPGDSLSEPLIIPPWEGDSEDYPGSCMRKHLVTMPGTVTGAQNNTARWDHYCCPQALQLASWESLSTRHCQRSTSENAHSGAVGWSMRFRISTKLPGDALSVLPRPHFQGPKVL